MDPGGGATAIRVPYLHIRDVETELVRLNSDAQQPKEEQASGHRAGAGAWHVHVAWSHARLAFAIGASALPPHPIHPDFRNRPCHDTVADFVQSY
ncbi:hypothetical protein ZWY2020_040096 [Hordeum vulgare]|nr:hypothetical protein ZWY2020_040096 [Hordeum vulgare]